jgi:hypothetical protein
MPLKLPSLRPVLLHLAAWAGFALYEQSVVLLTDAAHYKLLPVVATYGLNMVLFYLNSKALLPRFYGRRYWPYVPAALGVLGAYGLLRCAMYFHLEPALGLGMPAPEYSYTRFWVLAVYRGTFFLLASTGYWFAGNALVLEKQRRQQEHHLRLTEKSLMEANLAFLRNQINPHFLFNSLNFLYAQVYPHSENAAKGILLLSETMRYALHEDNKGKVMLAQEVKHLHNYIELNQLRFSNQLQVEFEVVGNIQFLMILPLVLITFVENCFKHGELADPVNPLVIHLVVKQNVLTFHTRNKKRLGPKERSTGIGLANIQKRLSIMYEGRYNLATKDEADFYTCDLTLEL